MVQLLRATQYGEDHYANIRSLVHFLSERLECASISLPSADSMGLVLKVRDP